LQEIVRLVQTFPAHALRL